jgi:NAD(P)-dependent dehydrogenase (short-subunit alcohol dehydrogenase family)
METSKRLAEKTAIVTGASRGLGRAYALRLARLGANVVIVDRDLKSAAVYGEELSAASVRDEVIALGRRSIEVEADLTQRRAADHVVSTTLDTFGSIDIIVNNVGGLITPMERSMASVIPQEDIAIMLNVNLMTTIHCCQAVAPVMKEQKSGVIINVSTAAARSIAAGGRMAIYGAAKAAVVQYTRSLASELGPFGIRANCLAPGIILTGRIKQQAQARGLGTAADVDRVALRRLGDAEDCAGVVEFLATDLSRYVTGQCISVCGGSVLTAAGRQHLRT